MKYVLYGHGGAYNHGAEAIVRCTVKLIRKIDSKSMIFLSTHFREQDEEFALPVDAYLERPEDYKKLAPAKWYQSTLDVVDATTLCFSIGGDNYCYPNWSRWNVIQEKAKEVGAKTVLWCCSIEPSMLDDDMCKALHLFDFIITRESITYKALVEKGFCQVKQIFDVAFLLPVQNAALFEGVSLKNSVAVNISPLVDRKEAVTGVIFHSVLQMIRDIIVKTELNILLVPHVFMPTDNDAMYLSNLYDNLLQEEKERVTLITENLCASEYKQIVSECKCAVVARTHAAIAAYSSCVPCLAIGYSVKAKGIAKDLDMERYVVPVNEIINENILSDRFFEMMQNIDQIETGLQKKMQSYINEDDLLQCVRSLQDMINN